MLNENKVVEENAEEERCAFCDEIIDECQCAEPPKCPICGDEASLGGEISLEHFDCNHLIAGWDDSEFRKSPFDGIVIPVLPAKRKTAGWSSEKLKEVFGEVEPLLEAYGGDFTDQPDEKELLDALINLVPDIVEESYYDLPPGARFGWEAYMYFAKKPDAARRRIAELMEKLQKGFEVLESSAGG